MKKYLIFKILFLIIVLQTNTTASNNIYLDKKDYTNYDLRLFIGTNFSYNYLQSSKSLDNSMYSYGLYIGMPIINNYDLILQHKQNKINQFSSLETSLSLNIPFSSRLTEQTYIGFKVGQGKITWKDHYINKYALLKDNTNGKFYGLSLGKKYKYTRNYYARFEMDYIRYNYNSKSTIKDVKNEYSFGINYSFEYRF
jgi:hypothetical protein